MLKLLKRFYHILTNIVFVERKVRVMELGFVMLMTQEHLTTSLAELTTNGVGLNPSTNDIDVEAKL